MTDEEQFAWAGQCESIGWERLLIHARREVALKDVLNQCIQDPPNYWSSILGLKTVQPVENRVIRYERA